MNLFAVGVVEVQVEASLIEYLMVFRGPGLLKTQMDQRSKSLWTTGVVVWRKRSLGKFSSRRSVICELGYSALAG